MVKIFIEKKLHEEVQEEARERVEPIKEVLILSNSIIGTTSRQTSSEAKSMKNVSMMKYNLGNRRGIQMTNDYIGLNASILMSPVAGYL